MGGYRLRQIVFSMKTGIMFPPSSSGIPVLYLYSFPPNISEEMCWEETQYKLLLGGLVGILLLPLAKNRKKHFNIAVMFFGQRQLSS